jgi:hypothetical protein
VTKYGNKKVTIDGYRFDSQAEARRYSELRLLANAGEITCLVVHPSFTILPEFRYRGKLVRPIKYFADFAYVEHGRDVVEDVKGIQTEAFKIKWKFMMSEFPNTDWRIIK